MANCCHIVGSLYVNEYVISVQVRSDTEMTKIGRSIIVGPTIGSVAVTGYATHSPHEECPGRAGVTINWIRKYDCDTNQLHLLFAGAGKSYISGDVGGLASIQSGGAVVTYPILNASAASGPTALYERATQTDGFGLEYSGHPYSFATSDEGGVKMGIPGVGTGDMYLQSFSLQCTPGQVPIASYNFVFVNMN